MDPRGPSLPNVEMAPDYALAGDPELRQANPSPENHKLCEANSSSIDEDLTTDQYLTRILAYPTGDYSSGRDDLGEHDLDTTLSCLLIITRHVHVKCCQPGLKCCMALGPKKYLLMPQTLDTLLSLTGLVRGSYILHYCCMTCFLFLQNLQNHGE